MKESVPRGTNDPDQHHPPTSKTARLVGGVSATPEPRHNTYMCSACTRSSNEVTHLAHSAIPQMNRRCRTKTTGASQHRSSHITEEKLENQFCIIR